MSHPKFGNQPEPFSYSKEYMKNFFNTKTVIGSLVVGLLGSALWENIFRDLLSFGGKTLLTISTLGIEEYKNDIYISIARGFYEQVSIQILSLGLGTFFGVVLGSILLTFRINEKYEEARKSKVREWLQVNRRFVRTGFLIYTIFVIGVSILSLSKITYINKSIAYYRQLENIAAPYLTSDQEKVLDARFAQIQNKGDYAKLMNDIAIIISGARQRLPVAPSFIF